MRHALSIFLGLLLSTGGLAVAQELEPRTYANTPVGVNFLAVGYAFSTGNVVMDPALPIEGLDADLNIYFVRYTRSFSLAGRNAKVKLLVPYSSGDWAGLLTDEGLAELLGRTTGFQTRSAEGLGDARLKLEWNFFGAPSHTPRELTPERESVAGASVQLILPTGDHDPEKLINLGSNRWGLRPEIGVSRSFGRWTLEGAFAAWFFGDNDEFLSQLTLSQDPLYAIKGHLIHSWRPGLWAALGVGYGTGGRTFVDGAPRNTEQENWRFAANVAIALNQSTGLVFGVGSMITDGAGPDFDALTFAYQYAWHEP